MSFDPTRSSVEGLCAAVERSGFSARPRVGNPATPGRTEGPIRFPRGLDVEWISRAGEEVDLEARRSPRKVTVFDFYAVWCIPCREVDREMIAILRSRSDVALRKINVVSWDSPVARQHLGDVAQLPYVVVYSRRARVVEAISGLRLDRLRRAIERAARE